MDKTLKKWRMFLFFSSRELRLDAAKFGEKKKFLFFFKNLIIYISYLIFINKIYILIKFLI